MVMPNHPSGRMCICQTVYCSKSFGSQKTEQIEYNSEREVPETEKQHVHHLALLIGNLSIEPVMLSDSTLLNDM